MDYTIALLEGTGRPARTDPMRAAIVAMVFVGLMGVGAFGYAVYLDVDTQIEANERWCADHERRIGELADTEALLKSVAQRRAILQARTGEIGTVLARGLQWSPILTAIAASVPEDIAICDLIVKRKAEPSDREKKQEGHVMIIGVVTRTGPAAVESFVRALRSAEALRPHIEEIRAANQQFKKVGERQVLYFVVECHFESCSHEGDRS